VYTNEQEIEDFLAEYGRSRVIIETTTRATLNRAVEFEYKFNRPFYQFTIEEALDMYESVHAISVVTLQNNNLVLKHAARWFAYKYNKKVSNTYEEMTKDQLSAVVDVAKQRSLILSREDINNLQSNLINAIDKAIVEMLFQGAGGQWLKELTFLDRNQLDRERLIIYFKTGKNLPVTDEICDLLIEAFNEDELVSFGSTTRVSKVAGNSLYKVRCNALSDNSDYHSDEDVQRRYRFAQRRLLLISKDLGVRLKASGLQASGLLHYIRLGIEETGLSFREFVKSEQARKLAQRYDIKSEDFYSQILIDKFEAYFI
jgi:hypothetical protein